MIKIHNRINNHNNVNFEHIDFYLHLEGVVATVVLSLNMEPERYTKLSIGLMIRTPLYCYYLLLDHENGKKCWSAVITYYMYILISYVTLFHIRISNGQYNIIHVSYNLIIIGGNYLSHYTHCVLYRSLVSIYRSLCICTSGNIIITIFLYDKLCRAIIT